MELSSRLTTIQRKESLMTGGFPGSQSDSIFKSFVVFGSVPIADTGENVDRPFADGVLEAKADDQVVGTPLVVGRLQGGERIFLRSNLLCIGGTVSPRDASPAQFGHAYTRCLGFDISR